MSSRFVIKQKQVKPLLIQYKHGTVCPLKTYKKDSVMLRIGKLTDYALLIMSQMAKDPVSVMSASVLAERLHLTTPTVSKILKILAESGLVSSVRGAVGGYHLALAPDEITIADILAAMEGDIAMTECCEKKDLCLLETNCLTRENWQKINGMVKTLLEKWTIVDMLSPLPNEVTLHDE